jgi:hypothetical protein
MSAQHRLRVGRLPPYLNNVAWCTQRFPCQVKRHSSNRHDRAVEMRVRSVSKVEPRTWNSPHWPVRMVPSVAPPTPPVAVASNVCSGSAQRQLLSSQTAAQAGRCIGGAVGRGLPAPCLRCAVGRIAVRQCRYRSQGGAVTATPAGRGSSGTDRKCGRRHSATSIAPSLRRWFLG